jgi:hypothetical protein
VVLSEVYAPAIAVPSSAPALLSLYSETPRVQEFRVLLSLYLLPTVYA